MLTVKYLLEFVGFTLLVAAAAMIARDLFYETTLGEARGGPVLALD